jgi:hypothetical protein
MAAPKQPERQLLQKLKFWNSLISFFFDLFDFAVEF